MSQRSLSLRLGDINATCQGGFLDPCDQDHMLQSRTDACLNKCSWILILALY